MAPKRKSLDVELARRHLDAGQRRFERQQKRVARQIAERRDPSAAQKLLTTLEMRLAHARYYLEALQGWHRKHPYRRIDGSVNRRLLDRKVRGKRKVDKTSQWNEQVVAALEKQFPDAPHYRSYVSNLWKKYLSLGLPNGHFVSEICSGKMETVAQRVWEMMLAAHFDALGFAMTSPNEGPDLRIGHDGHIIWIEAICPTPAGIPQDWMQPLSDGEFVVGDVPHNETLLRWTAAIKEKRDKLAEYQKKGVVRPEDSFVIAVNGGQLGRMPLNEGISQMPYALEAVYPAGPITLEIDQASGKVIRSFRSIRAHVLNANDEPVPTTAFLDRDNAAVSGVIGYSSDRSKSPLLTTDLVHNHLATNPIERGLLGPDNVEWAKSPKRDVRWRWASSVLNKPAFPTKKMRTKTDFRPILRFLWVGGGRMDGRAAGTELRYSEFEKGCSCLLEGISRTPFHQIHKPLETLEFREPYRIRGVQSSGEN
jgi:hypothetical protein